MPCNRCSTCGINYPLGVTKCRACEGKVDYVNDIADPDWQQKAELAAQAPSRRDDEEARIFSWRLDVLMKVGYPKTDAEDIARSSADLRRAEDLLRAGCPPGTAVLILI